jgi:spermidine synthase
VSARSPVLRDDGGELSLRFADATVQSRVCPAEPTRLLLEYTRLMMGFVLFQPAPARIAMIGLGGGSIARYCARKLPEAVFTAVEISPEVIALRHAFGLPPDGPRFRVVCDDGSVFVRRDAAPLDVLLVDGFDGDGQSEQLCTPAFYDDCRARLADGGMLVANLYTGDGASDVLVTRIRASFADRTAVVDADGSENQVIFAASGATAFPPAFPTLVERLRALRATHPVELDVIVRKLTRQRAPRARSPRPCPS